MSVLDAVSFVEGWTEAIDDQLFLGGVPRDLTDHIVTLQLTTCGGKSWDTKGLVLVTDAALGKISYVPHPEDLKAKGSPYRQRWRVTDPAGLVSYHPGGQPTRWIVHKL